MRTIHRAEILCVGTELLIGDIVNTNAAYLARGLANLGIGVYRQSVVGDNPARLTEDLETALSRADLVITSGGLGPTEDDLTKETAAAVFGRKMLLHEPSLARIKAYFAATGREMTENNRKQAMMPEGAIVFENSYGTAPALALVREDGKTLVLLPGPPRELKPLFSEQVVPFLRPRCDAVLLSRNVHITGLGESAAESVLPHDILASENPTVAPYCAPGELRLRVTARARNEQEAASLCDGMVARIEASPVAPYIYGIDIPSPEAELLRVLRLRGLTLATAESCTGGLIAKRLTDVPGASDVFAGGVVTYQDKQKTTLLGVPPSLIAAHTVVSREVALSMAEGARARLGADVALATTGYAGPCGGTEKEPVGTVYVALAGATGSRCIRLSLSSMRDRDYIRTVASTRALLLALEHCKIGCGE